ncbi:hypothetical protein, partial [uncultured Methylobacterium sp.]|uniref:hypothetical protein n=1 Tax=uncultured Methylobacterium sp. TaxID=157278 RepID=UPI0025996161
RPVNTPHDKHTKNRRHTHDGPLQAALAKARAIPQRHPSQWHAGATPPAWTTSFLPGQVA